MVEVRADVAREALVTQHRVPIKQQVVVVERLVGELALDIGAIEARQLLFPFRAPREMVPERVAQRPLSVHPVRIDREAGVLAREAALRLRIAELVAHHVHQIGGIAAIEHAEARRQAEAGAIAADEAIGNRVEGARPRQSNLCRELADDALRAARHFDRGAAGESQKQYALRIRAFEDQVGDAMRERVRLSGARSRENQERPRAVARGFALRAV